MVPNRPAKFKSFFKSERSSWSLKLFLCVTLVGTSYAYGEGTNNLHEEFRNLNEWRAHTFPKIPKASVLRPIASSESPHTALEMQTDNSASALILKSPLKVANNSLLKWSWRVTSPLPLLDPNSKSGDDYAIRIYVMASPESDVLSTWNRIKLLAADNFGDEKPGPTVAYVWTQSEDLRRCIPSPYTDMVKIIPFGRKEGEWSTEQVNPAKDFNECFGGEFVGTGRLAVMADSDNSHGKSVGYLAQLKFVSSQD